MRGINKVVWVDDLDGTPAMTHRPTGTEYKSRAFSGRLNSEDWRFIDLHEAAHALFDTTDEYEADKYASDQYLNSGGSPIASVRALAMGLPFTTPDHLNRLVLQFNRAAKYDCDVNKNKKACSLIEDNSMTGLAAFTKLAYHGVGLAAGVKGLSGFNGASVAIPKDVTIGRTALDAIMSSNGNQFSSFTDCGKYLLKSKQQACQKANDQEAAQQAALLAASNAVKYNTNSTAVNLAKISADALTQPEMQSTQLQYQYALDQLNSGKSGTTGGMSSNTIIIIAIAAAAAILLIITLMD